MKEIKEIKEMPTSLDGISESEMRSYNILEKVMIMIDRGDSKETIIELVEFLQDENIRPLYERLNEGLNGK
jgi:transposase